MENNIGSYNVTTLITSVGSSLLTYGLTHSFTATAGASVTSFGLLQTFKTGLLLHAEYLAQNLGMHFPSGPK